MTIALAFFAGVLAMLAALEIPDRWWLVGAWLFVLVVWISPLRCRRLLRLVAAFIAGMSLAGFQVIEWRELRQGTVAVVERMLIEGVVRGVPWREDGALHLQIDARRVDASGDARLRRFQLTWRESGVEPRVGERWQCLVRVRPLASTHNFHGLDLERIALRDRVHARAEVVPSRLNQRVEETTRAAIDSARARVARQIEVSVADPDAAALLTALAVGLTHNMSAEQWRVFNATGTSHLVAISGLHVTMFALVAFGCARFIWRSVAWVRGYVDREPLSWLLGLSAALGYSLLAGMSVPTQRTLIMLSAFALARVFARTSGPWASWSLALIAVLLVDPLAPLAAGFWLSFGAVAAIILASSLSLRPATGARLAIRVQLAVLLALAPLTLMVFGSVSLAGVWVNAIAIPVISFVLVPLVLAASVATFWCEPLARLCLTVASTLHDVCWPLLVSVADAPWALWKLTTPVGWLLLAAAAVSLFVLPAWHWGLRCAALLACAPLVFPASKDWPESTLALIRIFDAARGSLVMIATPTRTLLFDTGDSWGTAGSRLHHIALPALDAIGRRQVDGLVLPRLNPDRAQAAALLALERDVETVWVGGGWPGARLPARSCETNRFEDEALTMLMYAPRGQCVLKINAGGHSVLITGDLDTRGESALLNEHRLALKSSAVILTRPTGEPSSREWIDTLRPAILVASGGVPGSRTRHAILERWRQPGTKLFDVHRDGEVVLALSIDGVSVVETARKDRYPFLWRSPP